MLEIMIIDNIRLLFFGFQGSVFLGCQRDCMIIQNIYHTFMKAQKPPCLFPKKNCTFQWCEWIALRTTGWFDAPACAWGCMHAPPLLHQLGWLFLVVIFGCIFICLVVKYYWSPPPRDKACHLFVLGFFCILRLREFKNNDLANRLRLSVCQFKVWHLLIATCLVGC